MVSLFKRQLNIIILLVFLLTTILELCIFTYNNSAAYSNQKQLQQNEDIVLAELIALNLKIDTALEDKQLLEKRLDQNKQQSLLVEKGLAEIQEELKRQREKIGPLISFIYRFNFIDLLDVLVCSTDFNDFLNQTYMLSLIVEHYTEALNKVTELEHGLKSKDTNLKKINADISTDQKKINDNIAQLQQTKAQRTQLLAEIKQHSTELEARVTLLADRWSEANSTLITTMHMLSSLPQEELAPDQVKFKLNGMQVEFSEETINKVLTKTNSTNHPVKVMIKPDGTTIAGITHNTKTSFAVKGSFQIAPGGKEIVIIPHSFTVNKKTLEGDALAQISSNNTLSWNITNNLPFFSITNLLTDNGKVIITLANN